MIVQAPVLWGFEEDIINRSWLQWLSAHISFGKPLHRYEGILKIHANALVLEGQDIKNQEDIILEIDKWQIEEVYYGFDETFRASDTRGLGLTWLPVRLTLNTNSESRNLYLIVNYRFGKTDNQDFFEFLKRWLS